MKIVAISSSLNPQSRSAILIRSALELLQQKEIEADLIDLAQTELPFCDGGQAFEHENVAKLTDLLADADGILVGTPVYNYTVNAALKNLIELTGKAWQDKKVAFVAAAGGQGSYMALMPTINSLMLDYRCFVLPRYVYTTGAAYEGPELTDAEVKTRLSKLVDDFVSFTAALETLA